MQHNYHPYSSGSSVSQLWKDFKAGDKHAFEKIYRSYFDKLYNYGMSLCPKEPVIKDAIQQLFIEMWQSRNNLVDVENLSSYLIKSLRNKLIRVIDQEKKFDRLAVLDQVQEEGVPSREMIMIADQDALHKDAKLQLLVNELPVRQREAVILIFFEEKSYEEVSTILSMSVQSVYTLVWRAISTLRQKASF